MNDIKLKARYDIDASQYLQVSTFYTSTVGGYAYNWPYNTNANGDFTVNPPVITSTQTIIDNRSYDIYTTYAGNLAGTTPGTFYNPYYDVYTDDMIKRQNALVGLNYVNMLSDKLSLDTRLYYTFNTTRYDYNTTDADQEYPTGGGAIAGFTTPNYPSIKEPGDFNETDNHRYGLGSKLDWRVSDEHRLLFGIDGNIVDTRTTQVAAEYPVQNEFNNIQERNIAAFVQDEWKVTDKLTSLMSVRYDWSGIDADEVYTTDASTKVDLNNNSVDALSPRVALNYRATDDMAFRASWGKSFRAPSLYERFIRSAGIFTGTPNPDLDKETMTAYEIGMFKQFGKRVALDVSCFLNDYDDMIESVIDGTTFEYQNLNKARIYGVETNLNIRPIDEVNVNLAYTYMNAKNRSYDEDTAGALADNPDPEWLPYRPEHSASASVTWNTTKKLALNVSGRYVGKYNAISNFTNSEGDNYPGDFVLVNLGAKYKINDNFTTTLLCNNINNTQYEEVVWFRAPGRSFVLGVDFTY
ncbi:TonB-dependent receptor [Chlorobium phaeovibrioides]|uniref:TonB-dependent receptor n=1 Tax=Chlorobium phaeovibrioides TaxID=1094 RepID=UPI0035E3C0E7